MEAAISTQRGSIIAVIQNTIGSVDASWSPSNFGPKVFQKSAYAIHADAKYNQAIKQSPGHCGMNTSLATQQPAGECYRLVLISAHDQEESSAASGGNVAGRRRHREQPQSAHLQSVFNDACLPESHTRARSRRVRPQTGAWPHLCCRMHPGPHEKPSSSPRCLFEPPNHSQHAPSFGNQ